ncbi:hypothetical protein [Streptomyces sp. 058-1L]|uniref:hypothetical protein n=1 Tax=Streptomyces sp. 058-1L TaxID=2789266 RepID=UPI0039800407
MKSWEIVGDEEFLDWDVDTRDLFDGGQEFEAPQGVTAGGWCDRCRWGLGRKVGKCYAVGFTRARERDRVDDAGGRRDHECRQVFGESW